MNFKAAGGRCFLKFRYLFTCILFIIHQRCNFSTEEIKYFQSHKSGCRQPVMNRRFDGEWIRIILIEKECIGADSTLFLFDTNFFQRDRPPETGIVSCRDLRMHADERLTDRAVNASICGEDTASTAAEYGFRYRVLSIRYQRKHAEKCDADYFNDILLHSSSITLSFPEEQFLSPKKIPARRSVVSGESADALERYRKSVIHPIRPDANTIPAPQLIYRLQE